MDALSTPAATPSETEALAKEWSAGPARCETCGDRAWIHFGDQIPGQGPIVRHFCVTCAERLNPVVPIWRVQRTSPLSNASILIANGAFIAGLSIFADQLRLGGTKGFGFYQICGVVLSAVLLMAGGLLRAPTLVFTSMLIGALTVVADLLKLGLKPGFGPHQGLGLGLGAALILLGVLSALNKR